MLRSMLFLPGNTPNILINGDALGADSIILDLEDSVAPGEKDAARILVRNAMGRMGFSGCEVTVRINSIDTPYWQEDLDEILPQRPDLIMPTKVSGPEDVLAVDAYMAKWEDRLRWPRNTVGLIPLIETALGVENAFLIATSTPRVRALFLGGEDLTADLRCRRTKAGHELEYARGRLVMAARAAGVEVVDTPFTDVNDDEGAREDAAYAKSLGFSGKSAISPRHLPLINEVFTPGMEEIEDAYEVLEAIRTAREQGRGVVSLRGRMIDKPIVARAERTVAMARELGLGGMQDDETH